MSPQKYMFVHTNTKRLDLQPFLLNKNFEMTGIFISSNSWKQQAFLLLHGSWDLKGLGHMRKMIQSSQEIYRLLNLNKNVC